MCPRRLTRTAERRSNRLRVLVERSFLDSIPFYAEARESEIECKAVPKGPPLHFQITPVQLASPFDLAGKLRDAFRSSPPDVYDSNSNSLDVARWIAEEEATRQIKAAHCKAASGYRIDLPLWLHRHFDYPTRTPASRFLRSATCLNCTASRAGTNGSHQFSGGWKTKKTGGSCWRSCRRRG